MRNQPTSRLPNALLRQERLLRGWSQQVVGNNVGTDSYTVSRWERGRAQPSPYFRQRLCDLYGKNAQELGLLQEQKNVEAVPLINALSPKPLAQKRGFSPLVSPLLPQSDLPLYWQVPHQRNPFFTGRQHILQQLHRLLGEQYNIALTQSYALSGLGGIGKTQIAVEYAYRFSQDYSAVFWIGAETYENLLASFVSLAHCLDLSEKQEQEQSNVVAATLRWLNTHRDWLLIIDNVEDIEAVKRFLPASQRGALLFTTRLLTMGTLAQNIVVEQMSLEEGLELLLHRSGYFGLETSRQQLSLSDEDVARTLVEAMDGLPLALDQAAAYIEKMQCSLSDFLHLFRLFPVPLLRERDASLDHPVSVSRTFALSFERLQQTNPAAADLLTLCCFLAPDAIPEELIRQGESLLSPPLPPGFSELWQWNALLKDLLIYRLLQRNPQAKTITIHRLLQAVLKEELPEGAQKAWAERAIRLLSQTFSLDQHTLTTDQWPWCEQVLPHALLVMNLAERWHMTFPAYGSLLAKVATYLYQRARYTEAEDFYQRALSLQEQSLGSAHPELAVALTGLANTHHQQGKYQQSEIAYRRALSLVEASLGVDVLQLVAPLQGLAYLSFEMSRYEEAEDLYLQALRLCDQVLVDNHPPLAISLHDLADFYNHQGRYNEAEPLYLRALQIYEEGGRTDHYDGAGLLNSLGLLYLRRGRYTKAEPLFLHSLRIHEQVLGPEHPDVAAIVNNLAVLYRNQGCFQEAEPLLLRAVSIRERIFGPEHPYTAFFVDNLGVLFRKQGRYEEAEPLHLRALQIYERTHESDHCVIANPLSNLVQLRCEQGRYTEAEAWALRALHIREQALGPEHADVAASLVPLAILSREQGKYKQAELLFLRALRIREQVFGPEHPDVGSVLRELADLYGKQGRDEEAERLYQQALALSS